MEVAMKRFMLLLPLLAIVGGCAYPASSLSNGYSPQYPMRPRPHGPQLSVATLPVGRWDNVMMTAVGTPLFVLMMNGNMASGEVISATSDALRLHVASGEVNLAASEVMRVDRVTTNRDTVKDAARGAAFGAGVVGVLGLIVGHVPPPRLFAAGAIIGANQGVLDSRLAQGATMIYLARGVVPPGPGPQPDASETPRGVMGVNGPCGHKGSACNPNVRYRSSAVR
jgi:hypothetical protein